jgi:3-deoxy-D-manno-octulosonic-acid transferase
VPRLLNVLYLALVVLLSPWLLYSAVRKGKYRAGLSQKWLGLAPVRNSGRQCVWLHAVSVGEVNLLAPLLKVLEAEHPDWDFVISTTSAAGFALAKQKYAGRTVFYCPLDFTWAVNRALDRVQPDVLILAELELWPNLLHAAHRRGVAVAVFNGRLSEKSFRGYRRLGWFVNRVLANVDLIAAQNETYAERFRALGATNVHVSGNIKFDGAETNRDNPRTQKLAALAGIAADDIVFLAGSTQSPEEELALAAFQQLSPAHPKLRLVLVPRHPERFAEVAAMLDRSGMKWDRRSQLETRPADPAARVLLVDAVGELGAWWGTAQIGFIGGSLLNRRGGQNMIEPAAYGVAVCFGPNTSNFRDVVRLLLEHDAAMVVSSGDELTAFVEHCLREPQFADELGGRARELVLKQHGATQTTARLLAPFFEPPAQILSLPARRVA